MSSIGGIASNVDLQSSRVKSGRIRLGGPRIAVVRNAVRLLAVALAAASLAACARSSIVARQSESFAPSRSAALQHDRPASLVSTRPVAVASTSAPFVPSRNAATTAAGMPTASQGLASFYTEGTRTASGEKFNTLDMTAAHPTLPFGTRLRVTNVATGRSVTVRVNDRGPYVPGRIVDVSYSAAESLGMVGRGVAKVKLDVVR
jgi:peptidoglycan lytic transglycosylase